MGRRGWQDLPSEILRGKEEDYEKIFLKLVEECGIGATLDYVNNLDEKYEKAYRLSNKRRDTEKKHKEKNNTWI